MMIDDKLGIGTVQQTRSPWAFLVLFIGKKDSKLQKCFDYQHLNAVAVHNKSPLPLTVELMKSLLDAEDYTKLGICDAYGNLLVAEGNKDKLPLVSIFSFRTYCLIRSGRARQCTSMTSWCTQRITKFTGHTLLGSKSKATIANSQGNRNTGISVDLKSEDHTLDVGFGITPKRIFFFF